MGFGERDQGPTRKLSKGGFCAIAGYPIASGVTAGPPDAALYFKRHRSIRPGEISTERRWPAGLKPFLLLPMRPAHPGVQGMLPHKGEQGIADQPLSSKGFL